jgi:hypothetical protein
MDLDKKSFVIARRDNSNWKADLTVDHPQPDALELSGAMDGKQIEVKLTREANQNFLLSSRGFHWINEFPFNR